MFIELIYLKVFIVPFLVFPCISTCKYFAGVYNRYISQNQV